MTHVWAGHLYGVGSARAMLFRLGLARLRPHRLALGDNDSSVAEALLCGPADAVQQIDDGHDSAAGPHRNYCD